jgi:hypothetical protein
MSETIRDQDEDPQVWAGLVVYSRKPACPHVGGWSCWLWRVPAPRPWVVVIALLYASCHGFPSLSTRATLSRVDGWYSTLLLCNLSEQAHGEVHEGHVWSGRMDASSHEERPPLNQLFCDDREGAYSGVVIVTSSWDF